MTLYLHHHSTRKATWRLLILLLLQILFDKQHTPMLDTGLTLGMRLLYTSGRVRATWGHTSETCSCRE